MSKKIALALAVILAVSAVRTVCASGVDFDQNIDVKKIAEQIRGTEADGGYVPAVSAPVMVDESRIGTRWYTEDCVRFSFMHDTPLLSESVWLRSDEYKKECRIVNGIERCEDRYIRTYRGKAQILVRERELFPWEKEVFNVCLKGPWMNIYGLATAYEYNLAADNTVQYELIPGKKVPMNPDNEGLVLESFVFDTSVENFEMKVKDIWADYYAGERTVITVTLMKEVAFWFDHTILKREIVFDASPEYEIHFVDYIGEFSEYLREAKYYVKWGFRRQGEISKDKHQKKDSTDKIEISPARA